MKYLAHSSCAIFIVFLCCCHTVTSPTSFGLKPVKLDESYFNGSWVRDDSVDRFDVVVLDKEKSEIQITFDEGGASGPPKMRTVKAQILNGRKWRYASIPCADDGSEKNGYFFVCIHSTPTRTLIWMPDLPMFKSLVANGIIPGKVEKEDVILGEITPETIDMVESGRLGMLFDWQNPYVLKKIQPSGNRNVEQAVPPKSDRAGG